MFTLALLATLVFPAAGAAGGDAAWKSLLSLAGEWEGSYEGRTSTVTYTVVSGGNAVLESMKMPAPEPDMVTIYHRDGDALMATHYCSMGNQPRMRATNPAPDGKSIRFRFTDVTNLAKPGAGHIRHLTVTFVSPTEFTQEWTSLADGKETPANFKWTRKKK
jgi:hypothetical protein